jgi:hypothetical protein
MIRTRLWALPIGLLLLTPASCAGATGEPGSTAGPTGVRVVVVRSGGIAGGSDTITVEPQGQWTRVDDSGKQRSGRLTDDERTRLRALAGDPRLTAEAAQPTTPSNCRDGFNYALTVDSTRVGYVDCTGEKVRPETAMSIVGLLSKATG